MTASTTQPFISVTLQDIVPLVANIVEVTLLCPESFHWQAGDYVWVGIYPHELKPFSIANLVTDNYHQLRLQIAISDNLQLWWQQVSVQSSWLLQGPVAQYYWPSGDLPIMLLAGGTGITPLLSLLSAHQQQLVDRPVTLYWGVKHSSLAFTQALLNQFAQAYTLFNWKLVVSEAEPQWLGLRGNLPEVVASNIYPANAYQWLICGPWPMVQAVKHWLSSEQVDETHIQ